MQKLWRRFRAALRVAAPARSYRSVALKLESLETRVVLSGIDVTYHGGPLLQNVQIQSVYYGQPWTTDATLQGQIPQVDGFLQYFVTSPYMDVLKQYNVGNGTFLKHDIVNQNPSGGSTIDDSQIRQVLDAEITGTKNLAGPSTPNNSLYVFFTAPGVVVTASGLDSTFDFSDYHAAFTDSAGSTVYYAVVPYPTGLVADVQLTAFQQDTAILSNEVSNSITNPDSHTGWFDPLNGEIATIGQGTDGLLNGYVVQGVWSQSAGQIVIPGSSAATVQVNGAEVQANAGQPFTEIVAILTGAPASATASSYTAAINWGDSSITSAGIVTVDPNGGFDVTGTHTYSQTGSFLVSITVADQTGAAAGSALTSATVTGGTPSLSSNGTVLSLTAGQAFTGNVDTFTDSNTSATATNLTATINWGDGTTSAGTVVADPSGGFDVNGTHTYALPSQTQGGFSFLDSTLFGVLSGSGERQSFVVTATVQDTATGSAATALSLATVTSPPNIKAHGVNIAAVSGQSFSGVVSTFTDLLSGAAAGDFAATINWGDGTTSAGTVTADPSGGFDVSGTHTYSTATNFFGFGTLFGDQEFSIGTAITDTKTQDQAVTAELAAVASTSPKLTVVAQNIEATIGQSFSGLVATFTDVTAGATAAGFTSTIDWGDGTTSAGTITADPKGGFDVSGSHSYTVSSTPFSIFGGSHFGGLPFELGGGDFPISVSVASKTNSDAGTGQGNALLTPPAANGKVSGTLLPAVFGTPFSGTVATFTTTSSVAGLTAIIDWGDGTTSSGTIVPGAGGGYNVVGTHTYANTGFGGLGALFNGFQDNGTAPQPFFVSVTIQDAIGGTATAVSLAAVRAAPPRLAASGLSFNTTVGTVFSGTVASFTDSDGAAASSYTATIVWGDGSQSAGTIAANPSGGFLVGGTHTYAVSDTDIVFVIIHDADGDRAVSLGQATVSDGTPQASLNSVALGFVDSIEFFRNLITGFYQQFLKRTPAISEVAFWVNAMQNGATDTQVLTDFLSSPEFFGLNGNNNQAFVDALYQNLLGRAADPGGESFWLQKLADGATAQSVALGFATSQEREGMLISGFYQKFLGRTANAAEVAGWVDTFESGVTNDQIMAGFLSSQEYFLDQHANANDWLVSAYQNVLSRAPDLPGLTSWLAVLGQSQQ